MTTTTEDDLTIYTDLKGPEPHLQLYSYVKGFGKHIAYEAGIDNRIPAGRTSVKTAVFAMGCYWHAEVVFGGVHGVVATEVGFIGKVEVVRVYFDTEVASYIDLIRTWSDNHEVGVHESELEQSAIYATAEQRAEAEVEAEMLSTSSTRDGSCGHAEVRSIEPLHFRLAKQSDQLYHLRKTAPELLRQHDEGQVRVDQERLTRINSRIGMAQTYEDLLPPRPDCAQ
jgi:peptide methionine sulfoxide reductase MsrA